MKRSFILLVLSFHAFGLHAFGQKPVTDLAALRDRCIPDAPISTLAAIIQTESGGNPDALQIDFPNALLRRWHMRLGDTPACSTAERQRGSSRVDAISFKFRHLYGHRPDASKHGRSAAPQDRATQAFRSLHQSEDRMADPSRRLCH